MLTDFGLVGCEYYFDSLARDYVALLDAMDYMAAISHRLPVTIRRWLQCAANAQSYHSARVRLQTANQ